MISLTKLRLINWHLFSNETTPIENITFLTGANGTGKSTVIDAMQVVLLGDTAGRNFNKAANDKSTRTLLGYLKGDTGESSGGEIHYLRNGRFSSYVALQFHNDKNDQDFTLGIVFDIYEDETHDHSFFYLASPFPGNDFTKQEKGKKVPMSGKELTAYLKGQKDLDWRMFDSNSAYQLFLKEIFGNLPDKYFSLFKKAISFTPISNISTFITEFVCDIEHTIDIEPMRKNIEQYRLLQVEAAKIREKVEALNEIHDVYNLFNKSKSDLVMAQYLIDRVQGENSARTIAKLRQQIEANAARIDEIASILRDHENDASLLQSKKELLLAQKLGSDKYGAFAGAQAKKEAVEAKIARAKSDYRQLTIALNGYSLSFKSAINAFVNATRGYDKALIGESVSNAIDTLGEKCHDMLSLITKVADQIAEEKLTKATINEYQKATDSLVRLAVNLADQIDTVAQSTYLSLQSAQRDLEDLNKGTKTYPQGFLAIKEELESTLRRFHKDARVEVFCDLIDINEKKWVKAIEIALYAQKFNLFVNEEYFEEANEIMKGIMNHSFFRVSLVDTERLIERGFRTKEGSCATLISTDHQGARAYANFLLGNIAKCETFQEARDSGSGLLADCTGYRSFGTWYLNKKLGDVEYIGTSVSSGSLNSLKKDEEYLRNKLALIEEYENAVIAVGDCQVMSSYEASSYCDILDASDTSVLDKEVAMLQGNLDGSDLKDVTDVDVKIKEIEDDLKALNIQQNDLLKEQGSLEHDNRIAETSTIPELERSQNTFKARLVEKYGQKFIDETAEPFYDSCVAKLELDEIERQATNQVRLMTTKVGSYREKLFNLRSVYVASNSLSYATSNEESNEEYEAELASLHDFELPSYEQKIIEAKEKATKEFKDDFIYKIRSAIETVKAQIEELNQALKDVKFGKDSYRFTVEPNRDFRDYYDMITSDLLLNPKETSSDFEDKFAPVLEELFALISASDNEDAKEKSAILANIEKFTDYRTYLIFDLLVKRGPLGIESSLSRTFRRQSGGETQTPFYISILASFAQMYRVANSKNNDTLRLVIFDEAFSKMDSTRIKIMVELIKMFGLQSIISTPTEKIRDLAQSVDLIVVAMQDLKKSRSYLDRYQEKK